MPAFRTVAVASPETELPGNTRPPLFKSTAPRPGGPGSFSWWVVFLDAEGAPLVGGSASVQWYGGVFDGAAITTPTIGAAVAADALDTKSISFGAGVWAWCRVLSMTEPVGAVTAAVYLVESAAADVDTAAIASAVAVAVPTAAAIASAVADSAAVALAVQAAAEDAITAQVGAIQSGLATAAGLAPVVASVAALTESAFEHLGSDSEVEVLAAIPGFTIVVWGYEAYQFSATSVVEWRLSSGDGIEDPGNVDVTRPGRIPVGSSRIFPPGARGLFSGEPSKALFSKKDTGVDLSGTIWWTTIPNP